MVDEQVIGGLELCIVCHDGQYRAGKRRVIATSIDCCHVTNSRFLWTDKRYGLLIEREKAIYTEIMALNQPMSKEKKEKEGNYMLHKL